MTRLVTLASVVATLLSAGAHAQAPARERPPLVPVVGHDLKHDVSPPLFLIRPRAEAESLGEPHEPFPLPKARPRRDAKGTGPGVAGPSRSPASPLDTMPLPILSFDGVNNRNSVYPPDTNGDVGPDHYVQWVNLSFAVWDKQGTLVYGPVNGNTLWTGFGGLCETRNNGDPIALYDPIADRWLLSQLAIFDFSDYHQCIAISQTADPTGPWYRYDFLMSTTKLNDYPKFGVWPDAYYLAINQVTGPNRDWAGQGVMALERDKMLQGLPAQTVFFDLLAVNPNYGGAIPADFDGPTPPPPGAPNPFVEMDDDAWGWTPIDRLSVWHFHVDWANPGNSTFGVAGDPDQVIDTGAVGYPFDTNLCGYGPCLAQPGGPGLDTLSDRLMYRLVYRNWSGHESLTVNHTVDVGGIDHAGVRWYELRRAGGAWSIHQAGTHAPDSDHRWMASAAMDGSGDFAIGYSVTSHLTNPTVRYAGRLPGDPPGTLPRTEATLVAGGGIQTSGARWGDYSMLSVDPTDDCTFWYTQEYYSVSSERGWGSRIGSFRFPTCARCAAIGPASLFVERLTGALTRFTWSATANAAVHDVVRGSLSGLRAAAGDFAVATDTCLGSDLPGASADLADPDPTPGSGVFYLARGSALQCRGTFDEGSPTQQAGRDDGIAGADVACP